MRRWFALLGLGLLAVTNTGCLLNVYDSDPNIRMEQLLNQSEDLRQIRREWHAFWMTDQPSHMTPIRVHGGVGPAAGY